VKGEEEGKGKRREEEGAWSQKKFLVPPLQITEEIVS